MMNISVIIPAYKEKENLEVLLPKLQNVLGKINEKHEILVVDTQEKMDCTNEVCQKFHVKYLNRENGNFYGDAIRTGIKEAIGEKIVIMDADGSHDPKYLIEMYEVSKANDLVIGSRYVKNGKTENSLILIFMSLMVNVMYRLFLHLKVKDVSNSFRVYDGKKLKSIDITCSNFDLVEEILIKIILKYPRLTVKEVPIEFKKRLYGKSKRDLLKFILSYIVTMQRLVRIKGEFRRDYRKFVANSKGVEI